MTSSGFCLETLLEAAKFLEQQEQQQKQIFIVSSGTLKQIQEKEIEGPPLLLPKVEAVLPGPSIKLEELPSADDAKKPSPPTCYTNGITTSGAITTTNNHHPSPPASSVITPLSPAPALYPAHNPHPSTTTIINTATHLTTNHITFTSGLLHHSRPLLRKEEILLTTTTNGTHYVESFPSVGAPLSHSGALLTRAAYPVHMDDELMDSGDGESRLLTHGSYTSSSSSSLAGSIVSTSPNGCQSTEMIKKRSGISGIREVHNKLEKNRRAHLKECFEILKRQVPPAQEEKKSSNLSILHSAIRYIQFLRRREREFEHEMERLAREKIHAQQRLAHLKKELSARWEHIDFNTLIPDTMEVDVPYDNTPRDASLLSYEKDRSFMDEEGGMVIVTNGNGFIEHGAASEGVDSASSSCELSGGGERGDYVLRAVSAGGGGDGESWKGGEYVVRGGEGESWSGGRGGETLYSSSSSLSSTMSPLHHSQISQQHGVLTSQTHIQMVSSTNVTSSSSNSTSSSLLSSSNGRMLPATSSEHSQILTIHTPQHNGGLKSSPPHPHHLSPSSHSNSFRPAQQSTCQSSVIQSSVINTMTPSHTTAVFNGKTAASVLHGLGTATIIKSPDSMMANGNSTAKLVSLNSLPPGLITTHPNTQVLFTSQHPKLLPSTGAATPLTPALIKPLPSLQPISSPSLPTSHHHQLVLKGGSAGLVNGARVLVPQHGIVSATPSAASLQVKPVGSAARLVHK